MPLTIVQLQQQEPAGRHKSLRSSLPVFTYALHRTETEDCALTTDH